MTFVQRAVAGLILLAAALLPAASAQAPRKVALIIANSAYQNASSLVNPGNDARLVADSLRRIGFDPIVKNDLDWASTQAAFADFQEKSQGAAVAMIYYAGHGVEVGGANFLVPVSAKLETDARLRFEAVELNYALDALSGAKLRMVVLDACRDNPFARSLRRSIGSRSTAGAGLASVEKEDIFVMFAAASGETASDGDYTSGNSPFAKAFAQRVGERVEVRLMAGRVRDDVLSSTNNRQRPYVNGSLGGEEYYLVGAAPVQRSVSEASDVELRSWDQVRQFAAQGDCQVIQEHLQRYAEGATAYLARAALRQCAPRELQIAARQIQIVNPGQQAAAPATFSLDGLRAAERTSRLGSVDFDVVARRLGIDSVTLETVMRIESAGAGFAADGRPLILYDPSVFSRLTNGRYDASNSDLSQRVWSADAIGRTQAERWSRLTRAFALDPAAALSATSWGLMQQPGFSFANSNYPDVFAFVTEISQSESKQLIAYETYLRSVGALDELQRKDWAGYARIVRGIGNAQYVQAAQRIERELSYVAQGGGYIATLVADNPQRLSQSDFEAVAQRLGVEVAALRAVVKVQAGAASYGPDGRLIILFEPHIFSRLTSRRFDVSNPNVSYREWDASKYPRTQTGRWAQLAEAYSLDPEAALRSASYGLFQILGMNHAKAGYPTASEYVSAIAQSEVKQLEAFEGFIRGSNLTDELQRLDWEGFARIYNGPGQVDRYGRLLRDAYAEFKGCTSEAQPCP